MPRLFLDERNLRESGISEQNIRTLRELTAFQNLVTEQQETAAAVEAQQTAIDAVEEAVEDAELSLTSLDARVDDLEDFEAAGPYVKQDVGAAWTLPTGTVSRATYATHTAQVITNPPTQAEVQAIDDHVVVLSQRIAGLVTDLKGNGALT